MDDASPNRFIWTYNNYCCNYDNNRLDSNWSIEYTISNNQLLMYEEPEEGNPTSVYNIKELTKSKLVLLYKVDDSDGYKAEITTTFKKI